MQLACGSAEGKPGCLGFTAWERGGGTNQVEKRETASNLPQLTHSTGQEEAPAQALSGVPLGWGVLEDTQSYTLTPDPRDQYLQLLTLLSRQKAPASCLEENDVTGHQLFSLPLQPGDHTRLEENLGQGRKVQMRPLRGRVSEGAIQNPSLPS